MWECPSCRQRVEDRLETCWKCGTGRDGTPAPVDWADEQGVDGEVPFAAPAVSESQGVLPYEPVRRPTVPPVVKAVAYVFLAEGIVAAIHVAWAVYRNRLSINPGLLAVPICFGLLRLSPAWHAMTLVLLPIAIFVCTGEAILSYGLAWYPFRSILIAFAVVSIWQYRVLSRPAVRAVFERDNQGELK